VRRSNAGNDVLASGPIAGGTSLSKVLHTSQLSLTSTAGTDEQFVDKNNDLVADDRTTLDSTGGSFDIAVGKSGTRYEVFSATLNNALVGILITANDTNGDFVADLTNTYDLHRDFNLPSAAAVVTGNAIDGREFVIVSSSGFFNSANPNDPNNEPSPGIVLLVRDPNTGGFDAAQSKTLVTLGDNKLFNANGLALLPNNDLLIADFASDELRVIRDTNGDRIPDTLDTTPYYSYQFSDDAPIDIAVNSLGVVFSHSEGNDTLLLAIYDDNRDWRADHDEVAVEGLSIDNNLFLHGLTTDSNGTVYVIEDATASHDGSGGNMGTARIDAFRDPAQNGVLENGKLFVQADTNNLALSGLGFGPSNNSVQFQILLDQSGPVGDQAAALDSILLIRDPFPVVNSANLINPVSDPNTRLVIFVINMPIVPASSVVVNLIDSNNQSANVTPQDVRVIPNSEFVQITFRLPNNLPVGTCKIKVIAQGQTTNTATFRIRS
jgi:sugar lactone lactonase YvrE